MSSQRTTILDGFASRLAAYYGPAGTQAKWFRGVYRRAWQPGASLRPIATIEDGGQRRVDGEDTQEATARVLTVHTVIDLAEDWTRQANYQTWSDRIESVIRLFTNWMVPNGAVLLNRYVSDQPFEVVLAQAKSESIWIVEHEVMYTNVDEPDGNWA